MKKITLIALLFFVYGIIFNGCTRRAVVSSDYIQRISTTIISDSYGEVYAASLRMLQRQGFVIQNTDRESGVISAKRGYDTGTGSFLFSLFGVVEPPYRVQEDISMILTRMDYIHTKVFVQLEKTNFANPAFNGRSVLVEHISDYDVYRNLFAALTLELEKN